MTTTYELYTNENGTPKAVEGKAPAIIERVEALETDVTGLQSALDGKQAKGDYATTTVMNTELAKRAPVSHTHTVSQITDMPKVVLSVNDITPDDSGNVKVGALPLGHLFAWPFQTPPDGAIQCNGATYNRALYKDFFAYATSKGWVKTESEWQSIATSNGGFCPYYSQGDGSTTFRTPKFAPFMQVAIASGNVGKYHKAGLPDIQGSLVFGLVRSNSVSASGCFTKEDGSRSDWTGTTGTTNNEAVVTLKASNYNGVYGASTTVQPESHEWMICVVVAGQATNLGSLDIQDVMSAVGAVQANVSAIPKPNAYVTKTWHSGTSWYRVWSDGFIEQGGYYTSSANKNFTITLNRPMTTTYYHCTVTGGYKTVSDSGYGYVYGKTTSDFIAVVIEPSGTWEVRGY